MIILGNLGVANKRLINSFLEEWWNFDDVSYKQYHKGYDQAGEAMILGLKYHDPLIYEFVLEAIGGYQ